MSKEEEFRKNITENVQLMIKIRQAKEMAFGKNHAEACDIISSLTNEISRLSGIMDQLKKLCEDRIKSECGPPEKPYVVRAIITPHELLKIIKGEG